MTDSAATSRFDEAILRFDEANSGDPHRERIAGVDVPRELLYARRLTERVLALAPAASEALRLAARCQHLCRWEVPRDSYPGDRAGYLRWRRDLQQIHARKSGEILAAVGYDAATIARVQALNLKKDLGRDPEMQVLEDALCLVFLEHQLSELILKADEDKVVNALRKSWGKMSEAGRAAALKLNLAERERELLTKALSPE
ncbi:MAG: DUF4202 domain-containing protein [Limisphaerales bacterium]